MQWSTKTLMKEEKTLINFYVEKSKQSNKHTQKNTPARRVQRPYQGSWHQCTSWLCCGAIPALPICCRCLSEIYTAPPAGPNHTLLQNTNRDINSFLKHNYFKSFSLKSIFWQINLCFMVLTMFFLLMLSLRPKNLQGCACYLLSKSTLTLSHWPYLKSRSTQMNNIKSQLTCWTPQHSLYLGLKQNTWIQRR